MPRGLSLQFGSATLQNLGFVNSTKEHLLQAGSNVPFTQNQNNSQIVNTQQIPQGAIDLSKTSIPEIQIGQKISSVSTGYNSGNGFWLGGDAGIFKFFVGNSSGDKLLCDGTNLTITGALIAGSIHIPDQDTTANSMHTNSVGTSWWGCTETNFTANPDNAAAYITAAGVAKFQSVQLSNSVVISGLQAGSDIDGQYLTALSVTGGKIASATITGTNIAAATITGSNIASATITGSNIAASTITGANIASGTITGSNIASATITGANIDSATITATNIQSLTITAAEIADLTINGSKIASGSITPVKTTVPIFILSAGTFTDNDPIAGSVSWSGAKVVYNGTEHTITDDNTASRYVIWDSGAPTALSGSASVPTSDTAWLVGMNNSGTYLSIWDMSQIHGEQIQSASITGNQIANATITGGKIGSATITAANIANATITSSELSTTLMNQIEAQLPPDDILVAYFNLNEGSGTAVYDAKGGTTGAFNGSLAWGEGVSGACPVFTGVIADYIGGLLPYGAAQTNAGLSFWIQIADFAANHNFLYRIFGTSLYPRVYYTASTDTLNLQYQIDGITKTVAIANFSVGRAVDTWYNVVLEFDNTVGGTMYVDYDVDSATDATTGTSFNGGTNNMFIGRDSNLSYSLNGKVDEIRCFSRKLTNSERYALFKIPSGQPSTKVFGGNIQNNTIAAGKIENASITTTQISNSAGITGTQIANNTITASNIATATITAANIAAATITATEIASLTITAANIANSTITAGKMSVSELSAITAELGSAVISTTGYLRSGQTAWNTGTGWYIGFNSGNPVFSVGDGTPENSFTFDVVNGTQFNGTALSLQGFYGDGSDGSITTSGNVSFTSDVFATDYTVSTGDTVNLNGYRLFVTGTLTVNGNLQVTPNAGGNGGNGGNGSAAGATPGAAGTAGTAGAALSAGSVPGAVAGKAGAAGGVGKYISSGGGAGSNGTNGPAGTVGNNSSYAINTAGGATGANGGSGGDAGAVGITSTGGTAGAGAAGGTNTGTILNEIRSSVAAYLLYDQQTGTFYTSSPGSGSAAGGASGAVRVSSGSAASGGGGGGGGSGSPGGVLVVFAKTIVVSATGVIRALGGDGGNGGNAGSPDVLLGAIPSDVAAGGSAGGGGGAPGNGGTIILCYSKLTNDGTISVAAGVAGIGGTKSNGTTSTNHGGTPTAGNGTDGSTASSATAGQIIQIIN